MGKIEKSRQARSFKERAKKYIPLSIQKRLYSIIKKARHIKNIKSGRVITKKHLQNAFRQAGLKSGNIVLVHSSLGRIGHVENGPETVIDALLEIIGKSGLLVMPGFSALNYDKKRNMYVFDVQDTPTYTGAIPEAFRKRNGVKRSMSPTHSLCAFGKNAGKLIEGHDKVDNPFAMNGPFGKLYRWKAKIMLLGVDHLANSSLHIVEDKPYFPVKVFTEKFRVLMKDNGKEKIIEARRHTDHSRKTRDPNIMEKYCLRHKAMKILKIGNTELRVIDIKKFVDMMDGLCKRGITIYPAGIK
ncbi:AAC(3) family N-acetyltransferase [Candidatus Woesearchaeota archaeon]|nr:AAC(3) family N-acetyltransferase [Candidatus Woesearchaeota archaeon]